MRVERIRLVRITEATTVWLVLAATFGLVQLPGSALELLAFCGAVLIVIVLVAVVVTLALERRLPRLGLHDPYDGRATRVALAVGFVAFFTLLGVWMVIGGTPRTIWIIYLGMSYAMTVAGILTRRQIV